MLLMNIHIIKYRQYLWQQIGKSPKGFTLIAILVVITIVGILAAIAIPSFLHGRRIINTVSVAKTYISSMNKIQEGFYLENQKFAASIDALKFERSARHTQNYSYSLQAESQAVFHFATPKAYAIREERILFVDREVREPSNLIGFVGAVFVVPKTKTKDSKIVSIVCMGDKHSETLLPIPMLKDNVPVCANGTYWVK